MKVLITDDDINIVRMLENLLSLEGFETERAFNGKECLSKLQKEKIDLLILDMMMPELDGLSVLKMLREDKKFKNLPVIMLTAKTEDEAVFDSLKFGADYYIAKPFEIKDLLDGINLVLNRPKL